MKTIGRRGLGAARWCVAAVVAATAGRVFACSVCGCGDPLLAANDPAAIAGVLRLQLEAEYLSMDAGSDVAPGSIDRLTQWSYRLDAVYRPLDALSLTAVVPLVSKSLRTIGTAAGASSEVGLGDVELGARYALLTRVNLAARRVQQLAISAGTSVPTGSYDARAADGTLVDPHGQLGAGGWGPFAGVHYRLEQDDWIAFASASYRLRTEATYADGGRYALGDALLWSLHAQRLLGTRVALDLGVDGRYAWADRAADPGAAIASAVPNTGGTVLAAAPGLYLNAAGGLWLFVRAQVPFYTRLLGEQEVRPTVATGLQFEAL